MIYTLCLIGDFREYMQGFSAGITDCIISNRPESLRVPESHHIWRKLSDNYPSSFLENIWNKVYLERDKLMRNYTHLLYTGDAVIKQSTLNYISNVTSIAIHEAGIQNKKMSYIIERRLCDGFCENLYDNLAMMLNMCYPDIENYTGWSLDEHLNACYNENGNLLSDFTICVLFKKLKELDTEGRLNLLKSLGFPWNCIIPDTNRIISLTNSFLKSIKKHTQNFLSESQESCRGNIKGTKRLISRKFKVLDKFFQSILEEVKVEKPKSFFNFTCNVDTTNNNIQLISAKAVSLIKKKKLTKSLSLSKELSGYWYSNSESAYEDMI